MRSILFVVLSFRTADDTIDCIATLRDQPASDILVVDNGSSPEVVAAIANAYPDVELIALPANLGWAGGNNVGIRLGLERGYGAVCLLNNDTLLPPGASTRFLDVLDATGPAILHPSIKYYLDSEGMQLDPVHNVPPTTRFAPSTLIDGLFDMNTACGACMVIDRAIFEKVGLIDERFFLQLEETDFAMRAEAAGFRIYCDSMVRIVHRESSAYGARKLPRKTYYITRNSLLLAEKHRRNVPGYLQTLRQLYWSANQIATRSGALSKVGFLAWAVSRDPFATATRLGLRDYFLRRFGAASDAVLAAISK